MKSTRKNTLPVKVKGKPNRLTPQQSQFLDYYFKLNSDTYMNAYQSAIRAGYTPYYARNMASRNDIEWVVSARQTMYETVSTESLIAKARKNLDEAIEGKMDDEGKTYYKYKATEFVSSRADKDFTDKKLVDVTSAGLPLQEQLISALVKVYEE
jgi:hypothetical protein